MRIALDAMGGDGAPTSTVDGAWAYAARRPEAAAEIVLVGDESALREEVRRVGGGGDEFEILHASQVVDMQDSAVDALRSKPDSSVAAGVGAVRDGHADILVSVGHTGAAVAAATVGLRTLDGVRRPGLACLPEGDKGHFVLVDVGANVHPKPEHLLAYGIMGAEVSRILLDVAEPRVGLLNVGEEAGKGNALAKETHDLFATAPVQFIGNVEGTGLFRGAADVVVCEGFMGNVLLKTAEGLSSHLVDTFARLVAEHAPESTDAVMRALRDWSDVATYGGALLLGVNGAVIIGHGATDGRGVCSMLDQARRYVEGGVQDAITEGVAAAAEGV